MTHGEVVPVSRCSGIKDKSPKHIEEQKLRLHSTVHFDLDEEL